MPGRLRELDRTVRIWELRSAACGFIFGLEISILFWPLSWGARLTLAPIVLATFGAFVLFTRQRLARAQMLLELIRAAANTSKERR